LDVESIHTWSETIVYDLYQGFIDNYSKHTLNYKNK